MILSPLSSPFVSRSQHCTLFSRDTFICSLAKSLFDFDFRLFSSILTEWESSSLISSCLERWEKFVKKTESIKKGIHVLSFNVRGFDLRWQDVLLLTAKCESDMVSIPETGDIDITFCQQAFHDFSIFFQKGENKNGGVLILVRSQLYARRIRCDVPNVCIVELYLAVIIWESLASTYIPESRSCIWHHLSPIISKLSILYGDFNIDLEKDTTKTSRLLNWADTFLLAPYIPKQKTSLRSDRTIEYALSNGLDIHLLAHNGGTTSAHLPIISKINTVKNERLVGNSIHWKVFKALTGYTYPFWHNQWCLPHFDETYRLDIRFLSLLEARCTTKFSLQKYHTSIPPDLRSYLSYIRALSFQQLRTNCPHLKSIVEDWRKHAKYHHHHL